MRFQRFLDTVKENHWQLFGIEVYSGGQVIHSCHREPIRRYPIYSATKTITSLAVGIAADEGRFSIDVPIYEYLKGEVPAYATAKQIENLKKITVKRLLTMSVQGYPFRPQGDNWLEFSLLYPLENIGAAAFSYSNIPAYLVGAAVTRAVGEHLYSYLNPRLFCLLDIAEPVYKNCPSGYFYGASGMELTVHEVSKFGELLLNNGKFRGRQLVSADYVGEATKVQQLNKEGGYGYYIWKYRDGFRISGKWGQRCFVFPEQGLMITYLSHMEQGSEEMGRAVERYLLSDV